MKGEESPIDFVTREVTVNGRKYTVRELSLEEFEQVQKISSSDVKDASRSATVEMVILGVVSPKITAEQARKTGLGTLMKLGKEVLIACGLSDDEKKEDAG